MLLEFISANLSIILCFLLGIGLLVVEVFMPGFGLPGISGILLEIISVVLMYNSYGGLAALGLTIVVLAVMGIVVSVTLRSASKGRLSKSSIILNDRETVEDGYTATTDMEVFLGKEGVTLTPLRPTGMAEFEGVKLNVISDGEYVEKDVPVRIHHVEGARVVVRRLSRTDRASAGR